MLCCETSAFLSLFLLCSSTLLVDCTYELSFIRDAVVLLVVNVIFEFVTCSVRLYLDISLLQRVSQKPN